MNQIERIRAITANYFFWQGLRITAVGPVFIVTGLNSLKPAWYPFDVDSDWLPVLISAILGMLGFWLAGRYYAATLGTARGIPGQHLLRERVKWLLVYPALLVAPFTETWFAPKFGFSAVIWSAATILYWWSTGKGRMHYLPASALIAVCSVLPLLGVVAPGDESVGMTILVVGIVYVVCGLLDHLELMRIMRPVREGDHEPAV